MKRTAILGLIVLTLSGCAPFAAQRQREAIQEATRIAEACQQKRLSGELPNRVASAQCSNDRMHQVVAASGYPHMDLFDLFLAYRLALARRLDEETMTEEEARLKASELLTRIRTEEQQRNLMAQQAESQRLQSMGLFLQGLGVWQQSLTPPAPRGPITCYRYGNVTQCY
jgi:hypothetical protein